MKANIGMSRRLAALRSHQHAAPPLSDGLRELAESDLVVVGGATVLAPLVASSHVLPNPADPTGFEAFVNKIHISDFDGSCSLEHRLIHGLQFVDRLSPRLRQQRRPFRVILSLDPRFVGGDDPIFSAPTGKPMVLR